MLSFLRKRCFLFGSQFYQSGGNRRTDCIAHQERIEPEMRIHGAVVMVAMMVVVMIFYFIFFFIGNSGIAGQVIITILKLVSAGAF